MAHNHFIRNTKHATTYSLDSDMNLRSSVTSSLDAPAIDPIQVEVWRHLFASIAEEMGATLERTGFSPNIKERLDHSCALFDSAGRLLAQAAPGSVLDAATAQALQHSARARLSAEWTSACLEGGPHQVQGLAALARAIEAKGGKIFDKTHADGFKDGLPCEVTTQTGGIVSAGAIVVATNTPVNDWVAIHT